MSWDYLKTIDADALRPAFDELAGHKQAAAVELADNYKLVRRAEKRRCENLLRVANVAKVLEGLPAPGESWHIVTKGNFAMWDFVPAFLQLAAPATIRYLGIATLGFSQDNLAALLELLDARQIDRVDFLYSVYFKSNERDACDRLANELNARGQRVCAIRTHAKLLLFEISDGQAIAIESSANLRSCRNVEQMVLTHDPALIAFHRGWFDEAFAKQRD